MNKIPNRNDWIDELRVIALFTLLIIIMGAVFYVGVGTNAWGGGG